MVAVVLVSVVAGVVVQLVVLVEFAVAIMRVIVSVVVENL